MFVTFLRSIISKEAALCEIPVFVIHYSQRDHQRHSDSTNPHEVAAIWKEFYQHYSKHLPLFLGSCIMSFHSWRQWSQLKPPICTNPMMSCFTSKLFLKWPLSKNFQGSGKFYLIILSSEFPDFSSSPHIGLEISLDNVYGNSLVWGNSPAGGGKLPDWARPGMEMSHRVSAV